AAFEVGVISDNFEDIIMRSAIDRFYHRQTADLSKYVVLVVPLNEDADIRLIYKSSEHTLWQLKLNYYRN
ncbi:hypothetical protein, partial [Pseudoalteromonas phenolica]|uniref:hypothetical protein n=1 Tax=Pseudoalteromonas phenolica TaxID=161398 RepID=UPI00127C43AC